MIVVRLSGGLGNQLFQYAAARSMALRNKTKLYIDTGFYSSEANRVLKRKFALTHFSIQAQVISPSRFAYLTRSDLHFIQKIWRRGRYGRITYFIEGKAPDVKALYEQRIPLIIDGVFQSESYFAMYRDIVHTELYPAYQLTAKNNLQWVNEINNSVSVGVHIRRGDYVSIEQTANVHGTCNAAYYHNAMQHLRNMLENPFFYIFSDDTHWAINEFGSIPNVKIVTGMAESGTDQDMVEFKLLASCKHHVIANSSFSWWAAWLNTNPNKQIVGPKNWFLDKTLNELYQNILPAQWEKM